MLSKAEPQARPLAKLADFGISRLKKTSNESRESKLSEDRTRTPSWVAPKIFKECDNRGVANPEANVFSPGCGYILTKKHPIN